MVDFKTYRDRYAALPKSPLIVTATLSQPIKRNDDWNFDGVLAWAVMLEATRGEGLPPSGDDYDIPLPLERYGKQYPIWSASVLSPSDNIRDVHYLHKRAQDGRFTEGKGKDKRFTLNTASGRWMERRVPVSVVVTETLTARCVGNKEEVERLLTSYVGYVGGRRGAGFGCVHSWAVGDAGFESVLIADGKLTRPVPVNTATELGLQCDEPPVYVGFMPPYRTGISKTLCYDRGYYVAE